MSSELPGRETRSAEAAQDNRLEPDPGPAGDKITRRVAKLRED
jgi:hypothetical protein